MLLCTLTAGKCITGNLDIQVVQYAMESLLAKECVNSATTSFKRSILVEATNVGPYAALTVQ